jgi:hypothetical protein
LVGKTGHSYTYTQPVREDAKYNLYHGTLEAVPVTARTSRLIYSFFYDNSLLADDAAHIARLTLRELLATESQRKGWVSDGSAFHLPAPRYCRIAWAMLTHHHEPLRYVWMTKA